MDSEYGSSMVTKTGGAQKLLRALQTFTRLAETAHYSVVAVLPEGKQCSPKAMHSVRLRVRGLGARFLLRERAPPHGCSGQILVLSIAR